MTEAESGTHTPGSDTSDEPSAGGTQHASERRAREEEARLQNLFSERPRRAAPGWT